MPSLDRMMQAPARFVASYSVAVSDTIHGVIPTQVYVAGCVAGVLQFCSTTVAVEVLRCWVVLVVRVYVYVSVYVGVARDSNP